MKAEHFEILVEEPSMEAFLSKALPRILEGRATFKIHAYQGKPDLRAKLSSRLRGYAAWLPPASRIVVLLDKDDDDCVELKRELEAVADKVGLATKSRAIHGEWRVVNRVVVEELEAWFFGEWGAVRRAYPKVSASVPNKAAYRRCDEIAGGTWEALERILKNAGYYAGGLRKIELAREIGTHFNPDACVSPSFRALRGALAGAIA